MSDFDRRSFLKAGAAAALALTQPAVARSEARRPNFIVFVTDDQRFDELGIAGNPIIETPHIDAFARRGTVFRRAHVTTSICPTSRASILTGQYARRHGVNDFAIPLSEAQFAETYPALLRKSGYYTGFVGKYGIGRAYPADGFDFNRAFNGQGHYEVQMPSGEIRHITSVQADQALEFFAARDRDKPFCLSISFKAPHGQDGDPRQFIFDPADAELYKDVTIPEPPGFDPHAFDAFPEFFKKRNEGRARWQIRFSAPELFQTMVKGYYRLISGVDRAVGRVLAEVEKQGALNDTVILFTSDNGFYLGEHGLAGKWFGHEPSSRVPLIVTDERRPVAGGGRFIDRLALNVDIAPTILQVAGLPAPTRMQGRSLAPFLDGSEPADWRRDFLYEHLFVHPGIPNSEGVIGERHVYLRYRRGNDSFEELFDLATDPLELHNLASDPARQDLLARLRARTQQLAAEVE